MERELLRVLVLTDLHIPYLSGNSPRDRCIRIGPFFVRLPNRLWERTYLEAVTRYQTLLVQIRAEARLGGPVIGVSLGDLVFGYNDHDNSATFMRIREEVEKALEGYPLIAVPGNHDTYGTGSYRQYVEGFGGPAIWPVGEKTVLLFLDSEALLPKWLARRIIPNQDPNVWETQRRKNLELLHQAEKLYADGRTQQVAFMHFGWIAFLYGHLRQVKHLVFGHSHFGFSFRLPGLPDLHEVGGMAPVLWPVVRSELLVMRIDPREKITFERRRL